jgi:F1F0 ATPase subunit 2
MRLDPLSLLWGFGAGVGLGLIYFGALWLTVVRIGRVRRPWRLWLASFALRLALVLAAFYALLNHGWPVLAAALVGFLIGRQVWLVAKGKRTPPSSPSPSGRGSGHPEAVNRGQRS